MGVSRSIGRRLVDAVFRVTEGARGVAITEISGRGLKARLWRCCGRCVSHGSCCATRGTRRHRVDEISCGRFRAGRRPPSAEVLPQGTRLPSIRLYAGIHRPVESLAACVEMAFAASEEASLSAFLQDGGVWVSSRSETNFLLARFGRRLALPLAVIDALLFYGRCPEAGEKPLHSANAHRFYLRYV